MADELAHMLAEKFVAFRSREAKSAKELLTYKQVLDVAPCPMALIGKEGATEYVNFSFCTMLGVTSTRVLSDGWLCVVAQDDLERTRALWGAAVAGGLKDIEAWSHLKTAAGVHSVFWRAAQLHTGGYALAIFHPKCAFFKHPSGGNPPGCAVPGCTTSGLPEPSAWLLFLGGMQAKLPTLTKRQAEVLVLLCDEKSNREVAGILGISIKTVEKHRADLNALCGTDNILGVLRVGFRLGLVNYTPWVAKGFSSRPTTSQRHSAAGLCAPHAYRSAL
jgi:PAS domain S-box-containing protein